jgi:hypothetical protein
MADPLVSAPVVPPSIGLLHLRPEERRAGLLREFATLQGERDDHAERCTGAALVPNPCLRLWALDEQLRLIWGELTFLAADLVDVYPARACPPGCGECGRELAAVTPRNLLFRFTRDERVSHHATRCTFWDDGECICEAPAPALVS